jgi:hypothetical protein
MLYFVRYTLWIVFGFIKLVLKCQTSVREMFHTESAVRITYDIYNSYSHKVFWISVPVSVIMCFCLARDNTHIHCGKWTLSSNLLELADKLLVPHELSLYVRYLDIRTSDTSSNDWPFSLNYSAWKIDSNVWNNNYVSAKLRKSFNQQFILLGKWIFWISPLTSGF